MSFIQNTTISNFDYKVFICGAMSSGIMCTRQILLSENVRERTETGKFFSCLFTKCKAFHLLCFLNYFVLKKTKCFYFCSDFTVENSNVKNNQFNCVIFFLRLAIVAPMHQLEMEHIYVNANDIIYCLCGHVLGAENTRMPEYPHAVLSNVYEVEQRCVEFKVHANDFSRISMTMAMHHLDEELPLYHEVPLIDLTVDDDQEENQLDINLAEEFAYDMYENLSTDGNCFSTCVTPGVIDYYNHIWDEVEYNVHARDLEIGENNELSADLIAFLDENVNQTSRLDFDFNYLREHGLE